MKFEMPVDMLNKMVDDKKLIVESHAMCEEFLHTMYGLVQAHGNGADTALFVNLRILNMAAAKAAQALEIIHGIEDTRDPETGYRAAIVVYEHMISSMQKGLDKLKKHAIN